MFSIFNYQPKLVNEKRFEELREYFNYPIEYQKLYKKKDIPSHEFRDYVHTFFNRFVIPFQEKFYNPISLEKVNPNLRIVLDNIFQMLYEELQTLKVFEGIDYISEETWNKEIAHYIADQNIEKKAKAIALEKIKTMPKERIKSLLKEVLNEMFEGLEQAFSKEIEEVQRAHAKVQRQVHSLRVEANNIAEKASEKSVIEALRKEKMNLLEELFPLDHEFFQKDKSRVHYYEQRRKKETLEDSEKELNYRDREVSVREKELALSQKEQLFTFEIIQKDFEIERKSVELVQQMNLYELDKKELDVAYKLLQVERQGLLQAKDLMAIEKSLLDIRNSEHESKVRELMLNIREQKFNLQEMRRKVDYQNQKLNIQELLFNAKKEYQQISERTDEAKEKLYGYNKQLSTTMENYEYYRNQKEFLKKQIQYLNKDR